MYKIIKRKAKLFFKRLKNQNGAVVLTTLAILGIAALGASLFSFGEKAMEYKKNRVDMTKYGDAQASGDSGKDYEKNSAGFVEMAVEGGKVGAGAYDDTALLTVADKLGVFDVEKKEDKKDEEKNKENKEIEEKLKENNLPSDPLMVGITKVTENKVKRNSDSDATQEDIDEVVVDTMEEIQGYEELLDDEALSDEDKIKEPKFNIISHINKLLNAKDKLADQEVIEIRKELDKANSEKKYLEKEIKVYEDYEDKGYIVTNASEWASFEDRLDGLNNKISELTTEIQQYEDESQEVADEEDTSTDEEEPEEIGEAVESIITLTGTMDAPDSDPQKMFMTIDLKAGLVSGIIYLRINNEDITLDMDLPISGSINLETRVINAEVGDMELNGKLSADGKRANGTGSESVVWSVSR